MTLHPPLWAQDGSYPAALDRQLISGIFGGPRVADGLAVLPRSQGTNMSVDIHGGRVVIPGPAGDYFAMSDGIENREIGAPPTGGTSRLDAVVARVIDPDAMGEGDTLHWDIEVVPGTPAPDPIEPDTPGWSTLLALVRVHADTVAITPNDIIDARPMSGLLASIGRSAPTSTAGSIVIPISHGRSNFVLAEARTVLVGIYGSLQRGQTAPGLVTATARVDGSDISSIRQRIIEVGGPGSVIVSGVQPAVLDVGHHRLDATLTANTGTHSAFINAYWRAWVQEIGPAVTWAWTRV